MKAIKILIAIQSFPYLCGTHKVIINSSETNREFYEGKHEMQSPTLQTVSFWQEVF